MPTRPLRHAIALAVLAALASSPAGAEPRVRIIAAEPGSLWLEVHLDEAAAVQVTSGSVPGANEQTADSPAVDVTHVVRLARLPHGERIFYQVLANGAPVGPPLTTRTPVGWTARTASIQFSADVPSGAGAAEDEEAGRLFRRESDALVILGGDGGRPDDFVRLHSRSFTDRVVLEAGGSGDTASPRVVALSDLALAVLGDADPATAAAWTITALAAADTTCFKVIASARACPPDSPDRAALAALAASAAADAVVARIDGPSRLETVDGRPWLLLSDADGGDGRVRSRGLVQSKASTLTLSLEPGGSADSRVAITRDGGCGEPASVTKARVAAAEAAAAASAHGDGDEFESLSSDGDSHTADCDGP